MSATLKQGILFALLTAAISGFSIFYNKLVIVKGIDAVIFNLIKNGGVAIIFSLLLLGQKKHILSQLTRIQWLKLIAIGIIGGGIPFILFFEGLKSVSALNANLIHKSMFIWIALVAVPMLHEKITPLQILGFILVAISNVFIGGFSGFQIQSGEMMIIIATLLWVAETILAKIALKDIDAQIVGWGRMTIGTLCILLFGLFSNKLPLLSGLKSAQTLPLVGSILFLTGYVWFWFKALAYAPATAVSAVLITATPITNVLTAIFITHAFPHVQSYNLLGTMIGVCLIVFFRQRLTRPKTVEVKST